ncbi:MULTISPECIES: UV DNA damage repair endonuclease UvsE [Bacillus]|uniref:UV DNA damage repair endonuclease UvsE n=1 Tax=Bacillus TaxID=1386 RepID=UPI0001A186B9|nr:UV DNA damage repair endonuclease UvsE [Bacillus pseudomycoides]EEM14367.1 UV DNA damage endonuclease [Bacillus pseudomycoides DSM 12442]MDF2083489.1 UV DNA damage repair endonuclease UvsE [Bacillus pseudomycoides]MED1595688.1 UV DNA damage repair endonuclease UvsE [Bacillus pseudomycoides]MED4713585.1 UV DNA damage repair endonuclease UvsE [Bacillus pseudomycoides]OOR53052.1 UV damage endonuclease UvsE [Bacillus pseudomycoides]
MIMRFGYVSHAVALWDCSPAKTMTFTTWKKLGKQEREEKLYNITMQNLMHTLRTLHYNIAHEIPLYRLSSSIVPLATHPEVDFDYIDIFTPFWRKMGKLIREHNLRVSFHPNQFTLFTSEKPHITDNAVLDMTYHYNVLDAMGLADSSYINIHIGGAYGNKEKALLRFHENLKKLPPHIKQQMTLENDDKTYTASETLAVCKLERIPFIFDYHHHMANLCDEPLEALLPAIFKTWDHTNTIPKVHISSPKSEKEFRSHANYIDATFIKPFLHIMRELNQDFDIMIESKQKDLALFQFVDELASIRGVRRISGAALQW